MVISGDRKVMADVPAGRKIVVVVNLAPAKLTGQESQGMLLAATDAKGQFKFVTIAGALAEGSAIK